ncbi:hypothetical protein THRCLA_02687 [Thraustotheca clavata]|uniref:Transmembrane protein n=1 Tax=Thraustotheca clavata TaxID=74557 RepID=A0A1W0A4M3_9STRA|nr:hypothetical protein THRCLA_02687 [Thraustotheca clavata]
MVVESILPTNQWFARVLSTNETLIINRYFRDSDNAQSNYIRYLINMSGNPVRDFTIGTCHWGIVSWACVQGINILTLGIRIGFILCAAYIVSCRYFISTKHLWFPDVFPTIRQHIHIRSYLLIAAFVIDRFWALEERVFSVAFIRYSLLPLFILGANIRSNFLTLFLVWTDMWSSWLNLSVLPIVPTMLYILCYNNHDWIIQTFALPQSRTMFLIT